jgi:hypothetical protein
LLLAAAREALITTVAVVEPVGLQPIMVEQHLLSQQGQEHMQ